MPQRSGNICGHINDQPRRTAAALTLSDASDAAGAASSLSGSLQVGTAALGSVVANLTHRGSVVPLALIILFAGLAALCAAWRMDDSSRPRLTPGVSRNAD